MANFLTLVQELVTELGIGGANQGATVPTTVVGQTGQLWNAVNWIKQAENNLNLMYSDWKFLQVEYSELLVVGSTTVPAHSGSETVNQWDRDSFWLDQSLATAKQLEFMEWTNFRKQVFPGSSTRSNAKPSVITERRSGSVLLDNPPDSAYTLTAEFWKEPVLLAADNDISPIPSQYHRLIICEAAIKYGNKEAALEVIQGMEAEYIYLLDKLEGDQLEGREWERRATQDVPIEVAIPGYADDDLRAR